MESGALTASGSRLLVEIMGWSLLFTALGIAVLWGFSLAVWLLEQHTRHKKHSASQESQVPSDE
jgi:hypothetical protein